MGDAGGDDEAAMWALLKKMREATLGDGAADGGGGDGDAAARAAAAAPKRRMKELRRSLWDTDEPGEPGDAPELCCFCKTGRVVVDEGQHVCTSCFAIVQRVIDTGAEWRFYGSDDTRGGDPARCGMPTNTLLPRSALSTFVGGARSVSRDIRRIQRYQLWGSMPHAERALFAVFDHLRINTVKYGIPSKVVDDAITLYKKASEQRISRGDNKEGLIASCIYHACLVNRVPRSPKEVAAMFNIDPVVMTKGNSRFQNLLHLNVDTAGPDEFIGRFGSKLNMNYDDIQKCKAFARCLDDMEIVSESAPTSVAAGALYFYCTKKGLDEFARPLISAACNVSEVTIIKCYKRLLRFKEVAAAFAATTERPPTAAKTPGAAPAAPPAVAVAIAAGACAAAR